MTVQFFYRSTLWEVRWQSLMPKDCFVGIELEAKFADLKLKLP